MFRLGFPGSVVVSLALLCVSGQSVMAWDRPFCERVSGRTGLSCDWSSSRLTNPSAYEYHCCHEFDICSCIHDATPTVTPSTVPTSDYGVEISFCRQVSQARAEKVATGQRRGFRTPVVTNTGAVISSTSAPALITPGPHRLRVRRVRQLVSKESMRP